MAANPMASGDVGVELGAGYVEEHTPSGAWKEGLFGCFKNPVNCVRMSCCTMCSISSLYEKTVGPRGIAIVLLGMFSCAYLSGGGNVVFSDGTVGHVHMTLTGGTALLMYMSVAIYRYMYMSMYM